VLQKVGWTREAVRSSSKGPYREKLRGAVPGDVQDRVVLVGLRREKCPGKDDTPDGLRGREPEVLPRVGDDHLPRGHEAFVERRQGAGFGFDPLPVDLHLHAGAQVGDDVGLHPLELGVGHLDRVRGELEDLFEALEGDVDGPGDAVVLHLDAGNRELLVVGPGGGAPRQEEQGGPGGFHDSRYV